MTQPLVRRAVMAGVLAATSVLSVAVTTSPAHAQFGGIVYDLSLIHI